MYNIRAYKVSPNAAEIKQISIKRDWMDDTWNKHAYHCFPMTLTNGLGWGVSFPEDITFIWDGITDTTPDHVKILSGHQYCYSGRGSATLSFITNIKFVTDSDVSMLQMPVPNEFNENYKTYTTFISTSFYHESMPIAIRVIKPNVEITIKAGEPVAAIIPFSISSIQNSTIEFQDPSEQPIYKGVEDRLKIQDEMIKEYNWSDFYKNAEDHMGNKIGSHEVMAIRLGVKEYGNE